MRHRKGFNHLGRTSSHRKAMLSNMASSLILHKRITTTTAKAKALRTYIEPLITKSKNDTTHSRRVVFSYLRNKFAVAELFREVSPKVMERPGGYTRILKTGSRLGDNAEMCIIELVDYNENMLEDTSKKAKSTRRRRGSGKVKAKAADAETSTDAVDLQSTADTQEKPEEMPEKEATVKETPGDEADKEEATEETKVKSEAKEEAKTETVAADTEENKDKPEASEETKTGASPSDAEEKKTESEEVKSKDIDKEGDKKE